MRNLPIALTNALKIMVIIAACTPFSTGLSRPAGQIIAAGLPAPAAATVILNTNSYWRYFLTARKPLVGHAPQFTEVPKAGVDSALPPADWAAPDFDDLLWNRTRAPLFPGMDKTSPAGYSLFHQNDSDTALVCLRGKFIVADPSAAGDLNLSVSYRGGLIVYLNGKEVARDHMPADDKKGLESLADEYPDAAFLLAGGKIPKPGEAAGDPNILKARIRMLTDAKIPASALRKGVNVLALEIHRTPFPASFARPLTQEQGWATAGLASIELKASGAGMTANTDPPQGAHVWTQPASVRTYIDDYATPAEPIVPIHLAGARNGAFTGQVIISSSDSIKNPKVESSPLTGPAILQPASIEIRYGLTDGKHGGMGEFDGGSGTASFDTLNPNAPENIVPSKDHSVAQAVFVTVHVPNDAKAGQYKGTISVSADGMQKVEVPLEITVADWSLPDPADFLTHVGMVESPDTVAMQYGVELWSEKHLDLVGKVFALMAQTGRSDVYIPLQARLHMGNEQSMVRWIRKDGGGYTCDFSIVEKYLDTAIKNMGKPPVVVLWCWDKCNGLVYGKKENPNKPIRFTVLDPKTGKTEEAEGPAYGTPEARDFWKPVFEGLHKVFADRGIEKSMLLGLYGDSHPTKEAFDDLRAAAPGLRWVYRGHPEPRAEIFGQRLQDALGYYSFVYTHELPDPSVKRSYGWQADDILRTGFPRPAGIPYGNDLQNNTIPGRYRAYIEGAMTYGLQGIGGIGVDYWPVLKSGGHKGEICGRYPDNNWQQLSIDAAVCALVSPGKDGPLSTLRYEMLREGVQECQARAFIEKALLDPAQKAKLGDELAKNIQATLDARTRAIILDVSDWWFYTPWELNSADLYRAAAEVSKKIAG